MECTYFRRKTAGFSDEKRAVLIMALDNVIACPACKKVHPITEGSHVKH